MRTGALFHGIGISSRLYAWMPGTWISEVAKTGCKNCEGFQIKYGRNCSRLFKTRNILALRTQPLLVSESLYSQLPSWSHFWHSAGIDGPAVWEFWVFLCKTCSVFNNYSDSRAKEKRIINFFKKILIILYVHTVWIPVYFWIAV